jgi:hypothetical protein
MIMRKHIPAILLTLGLVVWFQEVFTVEWTSGYCSSQVDGPASAVYGMPLPFIRWSMVSSMEYLWMPAVLILNIALLFAIAFPFVSLLLRWSEARAARKGNVGLLRWSVSGLSTLLILNFVIWTGFQMYIGVYKIATSNIAMENYESYSQFRPVRFGLKTLRYDCTASDFWFPMREK